MANTNDSSAGFDGTRFILTSNADGVVKTARLAVGVHTNAEHDAFVSTLRTNYATIRQWALDAAAVNTNWAASGTYTATKDGNIRETIRRLGIFLDRFADFMQAENLDA